MCDHCMSSALNLKIIIEQYASSVQSRIDLLGSEETESEEEVNGGSTKTELDGGSTKTEFNGSSAKTEIDKGSAKPEIEKSSSDPEVASTSRVARKRAVERDETFTVNSNCNKRKTSEMDRKFRCDLCLKRYKSQKSLQIHRCSRTSECEHCHKFFVYGNALKKHVDVCVQKIIQKQFDLEAIATIPSQKSRDLRTVDQSLFDAATSANADAVEASPNAEEVNDDADAFEGARHESDHSNQSFSNEGLLDGNGISRAKHLIYR